MTIHQYGGKRRTATRPGPNAVGRSAPNAEAMPAPTEDERPTAYADRVGAWYVSQKSARHRKEHGLYLTPAPVADFMASKIPAGVPKIRILDPAAGAGILCCSVVESLAAREPRSTHIEIVAFEIDPDLIAPLRAVLDYLASWCQGLYGLTVTVQIAATDFILAHSEILKDSCDLFSTNAKEDLFDAVISNPPYFKLTKADPRAAAVATAVYGQPNIYALFMAVGAALLREGGSFVFITPRSFASGPYFRRFRNVFFDKIRPTEVHVFSSRRDTFKRDDVLQENVIVSGLRESAWHRKTATAPLVVSTSEGVGDIENATRRTVPIDRLLNVVSKDKVLRLSPSSRTDDVLRLVDSWPNTLQRLGLNISTGRVVPFRATSVIDKEGDVPATHVPLLWMNHVRAMRTTWPLDGHKPEYIAQSAARVLLVGNRNYVLLRRFSAKEEPRRLTAAPYLAEDLPVPAVGFENHLNYIHRPGGTLSKDEAWGLAALYNSRILDTYFRAINGNTQVSATEIRAIPLPQRTTIIALGKRARTLPAGSPGLEELVENVVVRGHGRKEVPFGQH